MASELKTLIQLQEHDSRLARLEAIEDIRVLKARYADVCDTGYDPDLMRPFFTEDAVWDGGRRFGRHEGIEAVCAFFASIIPAQRAASINPVKALRTE